MAGQGFCGGYSNIFVRKVRKKLNKVKVKSIMFFGLLPLRLMTLALFLSTRKKGGIFCVQICEMFGYMLFAWFYQQIPKHFADLPTTNSLLFFPGVPKNCFSNFLHFSVKNARKSKTIFFKILLFLPIHTFKKEILDLYIFE